MSILGAHAGRLSCPSVDTLLPATSCFLTVNTLLGVARKEAEWFKGKGHPCTGTEALYRPHGP
jgi:hypothetical protein